MNLTPAALAAIACAYLIGSFPTAYVLVRAIKGIDIRTLGSGNVGATNAGRVLGRNGFLSVFFIDLFKGLLPTLLLPLALKRSGYEIPNGLPVALAVAAILGHNFPVWLGFRGGKGVATTLGAVTALDPIASLAAAVAFGFSLTASRIVSLSSMVGAATFLAVYFIRTSEPFSEPHRIMSFATIGLAALLVFRHRTNLSRIAQGTEPHIRQRDRNASHNPPTPPRSGRVTLIALAGLILVALTFAAFAATRNTTTVIHAGALQLQPLGREQTGHQRAERVVFFEDGKTLAVACPRYDRLVLYDVTNDNRLDHPRHVKLAGKPMALAVHHGELIVLQRPSGDARHLRPGFWQRYDRIGNPIGNSVDVGYDPDDLAVIDQPQPVALVLLSGHAEGETNRPPPELLALDLRDINAPRPARRLVLHDPDLNPTRLILSRHHTHAAIVTRDETLIGVDLNNPLEPQRTGRVSIHNRTQPDLSAHDEDSILLTSPAALDPLVLHGLANEVIAWIDEPLGELVLCRVGQPSQLARYRPTGPFNRGEVRATGLAFHTEQGLLALTDRSGGVRLIAIQRSDLAQ